MKKTPPISTTKLGPGEYRPDIAFTRLEDLPPPKIIKQRRNYASRPCPHCRKPAPRDKVFTRQVHDVGDLVSDQPRELQITYSQHYCAACRKYFNADLSDVAPPGGHYTHRVMALAVRLVAEDGLPDRSASWTLWRDHRVVVPFATIQNWVEAGGKIVDNRTCQRLFYQVLTQDPTQADMIAFFQRFQAALQARHLTVRGITTDGSPLYPATILAVFGPVPHQICEFHILKDLNHAILRAVAQVRKQLAAQQPKLGRGRPTKAKRKLAQQRQRLQQKIADLFEYRHLFVQRHLTAAEPVILQRITRGLPQLRALRDIMNEVYRLFDRRCHTATALAKLARLRQRVQRFTQVRQVLKGVFSANLDKALTFLDDRLLGATSNAVERGNRRYRKMQKTVYRVRTADHIADRLALDLFREAAAQPRASTLSFLHRARAGA